MFACPGLDQATVRHFGQLMASGQVTPLIDRWYPLDQIVEAARHAETGQKIGGVMIIVGPSRYLPGARPDGGSAAGTLGTGSWPWERRPLSMCDVRAWG